MRCTAIILTLVVVAGACESGEHVDAPSVEGAGAALAATPRRYVCELGAILVDRSLDAEAVPVAVHPGAENDVAATVADSRGEAWDILVTEQLGWIRFEVTGPDGTGVDEIQAEVPTGTPGFRFKLSDAAFTAAGSNAGPPKETAASLSCALEGHAR